MKSIMQHMFSQVPRAEIQRSSFDRSHGYKTTFNVDRLIPIFVDEALPGDTFNLDMTGFARLSTPIYPIMDNMFLETFFFAVPMRILWDNWEKFNGAQASPGDSTDYQIPIITAPAITGHGETSLADYLGIPTGVAGLQHSAMFHRAYAKIYNDWFRDQNISPPLLENTGDGPDTTYASVQLRKKKHDYFTSCLPWPQKGDSVDLPLGTTAPITNNGSPFYLTDNYDDIGFALDHSTSNIYTQSAYGANPSINMYYYDGLQADLSTATSATINQLRQAFQVQRLLERDARGGTRYVEIIKAHFNVVSPDFRMQRAEYLGGGSTPVNISPIAQTSSTDGTSPQGNLAAMGTAVARNHGFTKSFTEHCIIMGIANVRADITYQQGLNRMFSRSTRYDFYWPELAHLGEQAVLNKEIYAQGTAVDDDVFGYQERYAEYRYKPSVITGSFRSNAGLPLDAWHLSEDFAALPSLSVAFINSNTPLGRVVAVPSQPHFIFDAYFKLRCARPMPLYGVPGMIDHF